MKRMWRLLTKCLIPVLTVGVCIMIYLSARVYHIFNFLTEGATIYSMNVYKADAQYGIKAIPNASGYIYFPGGDSIPIRIDDLGNRVSEKVNRKSSDHKTSKLLFIGDSYTFGDANSFEASFVGQISAKEDWEVINAGMVGYGYAQQFLRIEKLIEQHKPDFMAMQVSPSSAERAVSKYLSAFIKIPTPFFYRNKEGQVAVHQPLYQTNLFDVSRKYHLAQFRGMDNSFGNFLDFFWHGGFSLAAFESMMQAKTYLTARDLNSEISAEYVEAFFLEWLTALAASKSIHLFYYNIGFEPEQFNEKMAALSAEHAGKFFWVDFESRLWKNVSSHSEYSLMYQHWRGDPPKLIDTHYNEAANKLVSDEFVRVFKQHFP